MLSKHWLAAAILCAFLFPESGGAAVSDSDFQMRTTADLVDLCSASPTDSMGTAALNFCHGFALGVYRVLEEQNAARRTGKLFCISQPTPSRNEAIADFVQWSKANSEVMEGRPADGIAVYLASKYPCPRGK